MTSNWINKFKQAFPYDTEDMDTILERIDKLLRKAGRSTDDETLAEEIQREIEDEL